MARLVCLLAVLGLGAAPACASPLTLSLDGPGSATPVTVDGGGQVAGDVNGDGSPDLVTAKSSKRCYAVQVSFRGAPDWTPLGSLDITSAGSRCIYGGPNPVVPAGDVNGDGRADLLVFTALPVKDGTTTPGAVVVFGGGPGPAVDVDNLGERGFTIGNTSTGKAGIGIDPHVVHGDFDGDGHSDIVIGTTTSTRVVFGKTDNAPVDLADKATSPAVTLPKVARVTGWSSAGDMNGDGRAELVVGIQGDTSKPSTWGAWVVFGRAGRDPVDVGRDPAEFWIGRGGVPAGVGDVNGDGRADVAINDQLSGVVVFGKPDTTSVTVGSSGAFGGFRVTAPDACDQNLDPAPVAAGDVNGDGLGDVLLACAVVFGKTTTTPADASRPTASAFTLSGSQVRPDRFAALGDVNADGRADLLAADYRRSWLVHSPAAVSAPSVATIDAGSATGIPVLCVAHGGCQGSLDLRAPERTACGPDSVAAGEVVAAGDVTLGGGTLATLGAGLRPRITDLTLCGLGLPVVERLAVAGPPDEQQIELVPASIPAGKPWTVTGAGAKLRGRSDLQMFLDPAGTPFGVFYTEVGKHLQWRTLRAGRPAVALGLDAAEAAPWAPGRVLIGGMRGPNDTHRVTVYGFARPGARPAIAGRVDPGHVTWSAPTVAASGGRVALLAWDRRVSRGGSSRLVARFLGAHGLGPASPPLRLSADVQTRDVAVNAHGDGLVAWCGDPHVALTSARARGRFRAVQRVQDNAEGACGASAAAAGPKRRFAWVWSSWLDPYADDEDLEPTELRVAVGTAGGRFKVQLLDVSMTDATQQAPVGVVFAGTHVIAGYTSYDELTDKVRVVVRDVTTGDQRWLSPPLQDARLASIAARADGALVATWTAYDYQADTDRGVFASFARHGIDFGPPESLQTPDRSVTIAAEPGVAFDHGGAARSMWFSTRNRKSRVLYAKRP